LTGFGTGPADKQRDGSEWSLEMGDLDRSKRASLASKVWREEAGARLAELCRRLAVTPEGRSVIGIHVSCGVYGEWHYWAFIEHEPDTGPAMTRHFRQWLTSRYTSDAALQAAWKSSAWTLANAGVPDKQERERTMAGIFRDPAQEQRVIDYYRCQHEVVVDDIEYFCHIAKESWPRPLITGVFYGYFHMLFCRQASGGHLEVERVLNSPWVDYLSAPQGYWGESRGLGGCGNARGVIESANLHGKLWLDELDNGGLQKQPDDPLYHPVARRSMVLPLVRGTGVWFYDFGFDKQTGWWENQTVMADVAATQRLFDRLSQQPQQSAADVLVVWDQTSYYYLKNGWTPISYEQVDMANEEIWRSGAAVDHIYLFDIDKVDMQRYRAVVFTNVYHMTSAQRALVASRVAGGGRHLIWNYLPGYCDGSRLSLDFASELSGIRLRQCASGPKPRVSLSAPVASTYGNDAEVVPMACIDDPAVEVLGRLDGSGEAVVGRTKRATHTSVLATLPLRGANVFRGLFSEAGCHIYAKGDDPLFATAQLVMLHTASGGPRSVRLRNGKEVKLELPGPSTVLLDAVSGEDLFKGKSGH
jgi:hypothetical protein